MGDLPDIGEHIGDALLGRRVECHLRREIQTIEAVEARGAECREEPRADRARRFAADEGQGRWGRGLGAEAELSLESRVSERGVDDACARQPSQIVVR